MAHTTHLAILVVILFFCNTLAAAGLVERAEGDQLARSDGTSVPRVTRNEQGEVTHLYLNNMQLSPSEYSELASLVNLRSLVLYRTNVTDEDLPLLRQCPALEHLNLTGTEITDRAIETILELEQLRSLCLGNVKITPHAIEQLNERKRAHDHPLRWGYSQRQE